MNQIETAKKILIQQMEVLNEAIVGESKKESSLYDLNEIAKTSEVIARHAEAFKDLCMFDAMNGLTLENYIPSSEAEGFSSEETAE